MHAVEYCDEPRLKTCREIVAQDLGEGKKMAINLKVVES
jgi:hypothetical protein